MPNTSDMTAHTLTRLPGFLRKITGPDLCIRSHNRNNGYGGRVDQALSSGLYRNYQHWQPMIARYREIMTGGRQLRPLRVPIQNRILALVSAESRIPIPELCNPHRRHAPTSDITRARVLFVLLAVRVNNLSKSRSGMALNMSSSFGARAHGLGINWRASDPQFAERYGKLLASAGGFSLSNLIPQ